MAAMTLSREAGDLAEAVRRAQQEPVFVEQQGEAVAVVLSSEDYRRLQGAEAELEAAAYERIFGAFERGEAQPMREEDWEDLLAGRYRAAGPSDGLALPPRGRPW
jgi:prevent-host-death family protein